MSIQFFSEIGATEALTKVASSPNAIASKYAAQALKLIGEEVPHKLSQQVPLWTVQDVQEWVNQIGFKPYALEFVNSRVDGDLLLQVNESVLREDINIRNGILRRRFLRELAHLKRITDYSCCDGSNLYQLLNGLGPVYAQYTYPMLLAGVDDDTLKCVTDEQLSEECQIENSIHRLKIIDAIRSTLTRTTFLHKTNLICELLLLQAKIKRLQILTAMKTRNCLMCSLATEGAMDLNLLGKIRYFITEKFVTSFPILQSS